MYQELSTIYLKILSKTIDNLKPKNPTLSERCQKLISKIYLRFYFETSPDSTLLKCNFSELSLHGIFQSFFRPHFFKHL